MADILIAEDDARIRLYVAAALKEAGHTTRTAADGVATLSAYAERRPDLLVLDLMMPRKSGFDVCEELRKTDVSLPILVLTAKEAESDKILAFGLGADDYMTKPFSMGELKVRIGAILRRARLGETAGRVEDVFKFVSWKVDAAKFMLVAADGTKTPLTSLELGILRRRAAHPGEVIVRERFLNELWGVSYYGTTRTLDSRMSTLRHKLGSDGSYIETQRGIGYRFNPPGSRKSASRATSSRR